jgi:glycosyltransferase involved in cell wall biosynthesis
MLHAMTTGLLSTQAAAAEGTATNSPSSGRHPVILLAKRPHPDLPAQIRAGEHPRLEYLELAHRVGAEILDYHAVDASSLPAVQWITQRRGPYWGLAWLTFLRRHEFSTIYSTGEAIGLRLGMLLRAFGCNNRLIAVMHNMRTPKRLKLLRVLGHQIYRAVICYGEAQRRVLTKGAGLPSNKVHSLVHYCDQVFYRPASHTTGEYVLSVGMESRDYPTLQRAAEAFDYPFHVVASGWSPSAGFDPAAGIQKTANVTVGSGYSYMELRELYAAARFVVVPLQEVYYAAGVNAVVESMAMGKAVIVSATPGLSDYVKPGVSGLSVPVGDVQALRAAIVELWNAPERLEQIGRHNRRWVEESINMDRFVDTVVPLFEERPATRPVRVPAGM